jgi:hypothetical protein
MTDTETLAAEAPELLPEGEYAIVEIFGRRTLVGRVTEVERFGAKLMSIEPLFQGKMLDAVLIGGGSIYQLTPCSREQAAKHGPTEHYQLPASVRAALPPTMLPAPSFVDVDDEDEEMPF